MSEQEVEMTKHITCPKCGEQIPIIIGSLGRKPLNICVKNVYDALRSCSSVNRAAEKLGCSRAYIYKVLKENGTTVKEVMESRICKNSDFQKDDE